MNTEKMFGGISRLLGTKVRFRVKRLDCEFGFLELNLPLLYVNPSSISVFLRVNVDGNSDGPQ